MKDNWPIQSAQVRNSLRLLKMINDVLPSDVESLRKEVIELRAAKVKDAERIQACVNIVNGLYEALLRGDFAKAKVAAIAGAGRIKELMQ